MVPQFHLRKGFAFKSPKLPGLQGTADDTKTHYS